MPQPPRRTALSTLCFDFHYSFDLWQQMDAGNRKFPPYQPGSARGAVSAVHGSSLSSLSSAGSDDRVSGVRSGLGDIDWTVKYLTSNQARSLPFTVTSRLLRTADELFSQGARTSLSVYNVKQTCVFVCYVDVGFVFLYILLVGAGR